MLFSYAWFCIAVFVFPVTWTVFYACLGCIGCLLTVNRILMCSILFIPCIVDNQFTILQQQNSQYSSLDIYITIWHWTFLHVCIPKVISSGNQIKSNTAQKQTSNITSLFLCGVTLIWIPDDDSLGIETCRYLMWYYKYLRKSIVHFVGLLLWIGYFDVV
jgi:hypothetical protein